MRERHRGHVLQLRYGTFALFGTGDLEELADRLVGEISQASTRSAGERSSRDRAAEHQRLRERNSLADGAAPRWPCCPPATAN